MIKIDERRGIVTRTDIYSCILCERAPIAAFKKLNQAIQNAIQYFIFFQANDVGRFMAGGLCSKTFPKFAR